MGRTKLLQWVWALLLMIAGALSQQNSQNCPSHGEILPCKCAVKKNGLDILCEYTDHRQITIAMDALKGKPSLNIFYLKLRHNILPKLQGFIFLGLEISHLAVHNSSLAVVEESSLSSIGNQLTQLDLSLNHLQNVPSAAMKSLHHLLILTLNYNRISSVHDNAFNGLDTLEILSLYGNKITNVEQDAFKGLEKKLKRLNLGLNELVRVPQRALNYMEHLKKLEMQENNIGVITEDDFAGLRNLDTLVLAHNRLREVPARVFGHLKLLTSLELEGNEIDYIDIDAFSGLEENLQYLRLGDNKLNAIPSHALKRLHRLRTLDLRNNNISTLNDESFATYGDSLTFLNLQKNRIKTLPPTAFDNLNSLETLSLQNNGLKHIPEEIMEPVLDTLRTVDITDNNLVCDCELRWYSEWLTNLKGDMDDNMIKKRVVCTMTSEHREYNVLQLPLDKLNCVGKTEEHTRYGVSGASYVDLRQCSLLMSLAFLFAL